MLNHKNYNQIDNKQEKNLDLFQILGDCTNKIMKYFFFDIKSFVLFFEKKKNLKNRKFKIFNCQKN